MWKRLTFLILALAMLVGILLAASAAIAKDNSSSVLPRLESAKHQFLLPDQFNGRLDLNRNTNLVMTQIALKQPGYTWAYVKLYLDKGSKISIQPGAMTFTISDNGRISYANDLGYLAIRDYAVNECYDATHGPILLVSNADQGVADGQIRLLVRLPGNVSPISKIIQIALDMSKVTYSR